MTRKMGSSVSPVVELTEDNGTYTLKTTSPFKSTEIKFKLGEEFDEETADGRKVKSVCTLEGDKLVQLQKGDKDTTIEREFSAEEMKAVGIYFEKFILRITIQTRHGRDTVRVQFVKSGVKYSDII